MLSKVRISFGILALLALSACSSTQVPTPTTVQLGITGAANMNGGAPAKIKVYYLNSPAIFRSSDFFAVFNAAEETLGADLVTVDEFQLAPGRTVTDTASFNTAPAAIGVVAAFRDIDGANFLAVKPLIPNTANPVQITVTGNTVTIR
ncbi:type VI secretion system lipoprotein TssJ [Parasulfitobacter algicola]|uniref:Type VI secretion system lipoprotein TssJ n=1 Tax=Parasulfitobacter algicola TaxID=2614809 RepID=A0ABX2IMX1_9RHOB|nr:type VI secretion system lipoprotein TssJ [Sulfitobacter algicola]NSX53690.1 type VI secretion system lipoprotein TssJ [Sulfitobacter algicola]